MKIRCHP